jgi:hypothetical protein
MGATGSIAYCFKQNFTFLPPVYDSVICRPVQIGGRCVQAITVDEVVEVVNVLLSEK